MNSAEPTASGPTASGPTASGPTASGPTSLAEYGGWKGVLSDLVAGNDLSAVVAHAALGNILTNQATDAQIAGFIIALGMKGGSVPELTGMVEAMLDVSEPLELPAGTIDIVGSGGGARRQQHALSVSTMACVVAAAAGAVICKHGSVKASSSSGSFDTLAALGFFTDLSGPQVQQCVTTHGLGFALAKRFHSAMRLVAPVRSELGVPTTFNYLGPLAHPGRVRRQVVGVSHAAMAPRLAAVLAARGSEHALVVHGADGLDEITTTDVTRIYEVIDGELVRDYLFDPADVGLKRSNNADLTGGSPQDNAQILNQIVAGTETGERANIVALNAAAGLLVAGVVSDMAAGLEAARAAIADGRAASKLAATAELTRQLGAEAVSG